ncbi:MAG: hypothetical protein Q8O64_03885, partial [Sideroxyarcus sp.]|nr:hypothetical protein [Sideroxyarcus sp.]
AFILYRRWYGLDNRRGGEKRQVFFDEETVLREVRRIQNARKRHGYAPWTNAWPRRSAGKGALF